MTTVSREMLALADEFEAGSNAIDDVRRALVVAALRKPADDDVRDALRPFAQTGWLTSDTEHTARTVVAHMHPESEREIVLSSDDFYRAARVYSALSTKAKP